MEKATPGQAHKFLKAYPPFYFFEEKVLAGLSDQVIENTRSKGETIFRQGEMPGSFIFIVRQGSIDLFMEERGQRELIDRCDEGQLFGLRPLLAGSTYALTAIAAEETVLYELPAAGFRLAAETTPKAMLYIAANFASGWQWRQLPGIKEKLSINKDQPEQDAFQLLEMQSLDYSKSLATCTIEQSIQEVAFIMSEKEVGSIIILSENNKPLGVVTDKDLRKKVATGKESIFSPVSSIMSSPVITAHPSITVTDVQMEMIKNKMNHLVLTEDGTNTSKVVGVLTEHDMLLFQSNSPVVLIKEIEGADNTKELHHIRDRAERLLQKYLHREVAISYIASIFTEINDALLLRLIHLAEKQLNEAGMSPPEAKFCWLALGSEGREEQLLRTDQDNALIFENVSPAKYRATKEYYVQLGKTVNDLLNACGFAYCPGEYMAGNPKWCLSLNEWKELFTHWILEPDPVALLHSTVFFDYRPVFGAESLAHQLTEHIFEIINEQHLFFMHFGKCALENPPPLTFFRDIMVERSGEYKNQFDIKKRAMTPLTDAARVLVLHNKISKINSTPGRFQELARREPNNKELYEHAADAYRILMRFRTMQGLKHGNSGRYFNPSELSKMERTLLRNLFRPINDLQLLIKIRFQTGFF